MKFDERTVDTLQRQRELERERVRETASEREYEEL